jgi:hypothetical protein
MVVIRRDIINVLFPSGYWPITIAEPGRCRFKPEPSQKMRQMELFFAASRPVKKI